MRTFPSTSSTGSVPPYRCGRHSLPKWFPSVSQSVPMNKIFKNKKNLRHFQLSTLKTHSFSQFRLNERLKYFKKNIECVRSIDHIDALHTQWHTLLQPLQKHRCKHRRKVNDLIQRETYKKIWNEMQIDEKYSRNYLQSPLLLRRHWSDEILKKY